MAFKIRAKLLIAFFVMLIPFFVFAYLTNLTYRTIHKNVLRMDVLHRELVGRAFNIMGEKLKEFYSGLEEKVGERTKELQQRLDELERFREATVHREFRIKELRDKIAELEKELEEIKEKG